MTSTYLPRVVDAQVAKALRGAGAVVIEGSKACGKTTTAEQFAESSVHLDRDTAQRTAGKADPNVLLVGSTPRLIDEWQLVPEVWNAARGAIDQRQQPGQFIFTGSATPADNQTRHSGAMRFLRLTMRPMSLLESRISTGDVSLKGLWTGGPLPASAESSSLEEIADAACRGGWPALVNVDVDLAQDLNKSYLRAIASTDIITVDGTKRDPRKVSALLAALARNTGTYVSNRRLQTDSATFGQTIDPSTITAYLDALERLWVYCPQWAWGGHLRSSAAARKAPKRHLVDPSLAAAAMDASPDDLLADHEAFGQVFETLVFRDLSVYAEANGMQVAAFSDAKQNEIDAVIIKGTKWAGIEVKLAAIPEVVDRAADKITSIAQRMRTPPNFLAIVTANGPSYTRPDGVHVLSIARLGV